MNDFRIKNIFLLMKFFYGNYFLKLKQNFHFELQIQILEISQNKMQKNDILDLGKNVLPFNLVSKSILTSYFVEKRSRNMHISS